MAPPFGRRQRSVAQQKGGRIVCQGWCPRLRGRSLTLSGAAFVTLLWPEARDSSIFRPVQEGSRRGRRLSRSGVRSVRLPRLLCPHGRDLQKELEVLIGRGLVKARIDSHSKVLYAQLTNQRSTSFQYALKTGVRSGAHSPPSPAHPACLAGWSANPGFFLHEGRLSYSCGRVGAVCEEGEARSMQAPNLNGWVASGIRHSC